MKKLALIASLFLAIVSVTSAETMSLTILHTNDIHGHLVPIINKKENIEKGGIIRQSGLINKIRNEVGTSSLLLLDAGDLSHGTAYSGIFKDRPNFKASRLIGFEALTLGNHEFNNGLTALQELVKECGNNILCCNLLNKNTGKPIFKPYQVFIRNNIKIAVIGCIGVAAWDGVNKSKNTNIKFVGELEAVREYAEKLRQNNDLIVVLSHCGIDEDKLLAQELGEIDVIIGGHTHTEIPEPLLVRNRNKVRNCANELNGTIICQTGSNGNNLGRLNLEFNNNKKLSKYNGSLIKVSSQHENYASPSVIRLVNRYKNDLQKILGDKVAHTNFPLLHAGKNNRDKPSSIGIFVAESMRSASKADLCIINSGSIKYSMEPGDITKKDLYEAAGFEDNLITYKMKGDYLKKALDFFAANYRNYDGYQFAGINVVFNTKNGTAEQIKICNETLKADKIYTLCTNSFMANGNDFGNVIFAKGTNKTDTGLSIYEALLKYCESIKELPDFNFVNYSYIK